MAFGCFSQIDLFKSPEPRDNICGSVVRFFEPARAPSTCIGLLVLQLLLLLLLPLLLPLSPLPLWSAGVLLFRSRCRRRHVRGPSFWWRCSPHGHVPPSPPPCATGDGVVVHLAVGASCCHLPFQWGWRLVSRGQYATGGLGRA